ncbi:MAG: 3'-5' exonuclease [Alloprevotella sp.]|nr:3'-5' exonuclease [Bacteroidales bacterium]MDY3943901.1 3'-5' exonuclease [Alloprevotella sp.]
MQLNLSRPLVFFDIEATGLNTATDRIVELCMVKVFPDGKDEVRTLRFNPTIPISPEASAVNGITDEDVANCPRFADMASDLDNYFANCDLAGYNSNSFDIPMLVEEFIRAGVNFDLTTRRFIDVQTVFHKMEPRTLTAAYKYYCQKELVDAHSAEADTVATYEVLKAQLDRYDEVQNDVDWLADFTRRNNNVDLAGRIVLNDENVEVINFGKYRGRPVRDVLRYDQGYYNWIMQGDFPQNTKQVFMQLKLRYDNE